MKVKYLKEVGRIKAGDVHIVNSAEQVAYMVEKGMAEVTEEGHTKLPFIGSDPYRSENDVAKENAAISAYNAGMNTPAEEVKKDEPVDVSNKKAKKA